MQKKCPVPNCVRNIIPSQNNYGMCIKHEEWLDFVVFALNNRIKQQEPVKKAADGTVQTSSGLWVPSK